MKIGLSSRFKAQKKAKAREYGNFLCSFSLSATATASTMRTPFVGFLKVEQPKRRNVRSPLPSSTWIEHLHEQTFPPMKRGERTHYNTPLCKGRLLKRNLCTPRFLAKMSFRRTKGERKLEKGIMTGCRNEHEIYVNYMKTKLHFYSPELQKNKVNKIAHQD